MTTYINKWTGRGYYSLACLALRTNAGETAGLALSKFQMTPVKVCQLVSCISFFQSEQNKFLGRSEQGICPAQLAHSSVPFVGFGPKNESALLKPGN